MKLFGDGVEPSDELFAACWKWGAIVGAVVGLLGGFHDGGVGGAILGLIVGVVLGSIVGLQLAFAPGCVMGLLAWGAIIGIPIGIIYLIINLWGVGKP